MNGCAASCETGYRNGTVYASVTGPVTAVACTTLGTVMTGGVSCRHLHLWLWRTVVLHLLAVIIVIIISSRHDRQGECAAQRWNHQCQGDQNKKNISALSAHVLNQGKPCRGKESRCVPHRYIYWFGQSLTLLMLVAGESRYLYVIDFLSNTRQETYSWLPSVHGFYQHIGHVGQYFLWLRSKQLW